MRRRSTIRIPYSPVKGGKRYWQPNSEMKEHGFLPKPLGEDGPASRAEARRLYAEWQEYSDRLKFGEAPPTAYPAGSMGAAWQRMKATPAIWEAKKPRTQEEWEYVWDKWLERVFGDTDPNSVTVETIANLRDYVEQKHGPAPEVQADQDLARILAGHGGDAILPKLRRPIQGIHQPCPSGPLGNVERG